MDNGQLEYCLPGSAKFQYSVGLDIKYHEVWSSNGVHKLTGVGILVSWGGSLEHHLRGQVLTG